MSLPHVSILFSGVGFTHCWGLFASLLEVLGAIYPVLFLGWFSRCTIKLQRAMKAFFLIFFPLKSLYIKNVPYPVLFLVWFSRCTIKLQRAMKAFFLIVFPLKSLYIKNVPGTFYFLV